MTSGFPLEHLRWEKDLALHTHHTPITKALGLD